MSLIVKKLFICIIIILSFSLMAKENNNNVLAMVKNELWYQGISNNIEQIQNNPNNSVVRKLPLEDFKGDVSELFSALSHIK